MHLKDLSMRSRLCSNVRAKSQLARPRRLGLVRLARDRARPCTSKTIGRQGFSCNSLFRGLFGSRKNDDEQDTAEVVPELMLPFPVELLDSTYLKGRALARAFRASEDGFSALAFHNRVDLKGPCVIYAETSEGVRFGGFNPQGFCSSDDYTSSFSAFLFCWPPGSDEVVVLKKVGGSEAAVFDYARGGPQWGADGLVIGPPRAPVMGGFAGPDAPMDSAGSLRAARCRLGQAYEMIPPEYGHRSLFGGEAAEATLREVEVYYAPELAALYK
uniref:TLDc domain-containing protein n=1 Tax=Tetraselmis sp. GSL018 TaxID=582737 RepID=A0A061S6C0_9CHLO